MEQFQNICQIVRTLSSERLSISTVLPSHGYRESNSKEDLVHGSFMSIILLGASCFRLAFKAHFTSRDIKNLLTKIGAESRKLNEENIRDYMREYCNLVAGGVKSYFNDAGVSSGISLPLVTDGFDEVLYVNNQKADMHKDMWEVYWDGGQVVCSLQIEVLDKTQFQNLKVDPFPIKGQETSEEDAFL